MTLNQTELTEKRCRLRDLGVSVGFFPPGQHNAITDVPGVTVGHQTLIRDLPTVVRTGVTAIMPRPNLHQDPVFAGFFSLNGVGEMTGTHLVEEWGLLSSPVIMTHTTQVGLARDALSVYGDQFKTQFAYKLAVAGETYAGWLSDSESMPLTEADVFAALENAQPGPVAEGGVGGGTGMTCYDFKGGIGTSSRVVRVGGHHYTVGAIVQANHGERHTLRVDGVPVGVEIPLDEIPGTTDTPDSVKTGRDDQYTPTQEARSSSILVILATDAPLLPVQCERLAKRGALGLARTGGVAQNSSGDLFLTFSTGNHYPVDAEAPLDVKMLPHYQMDALFEAAIEAVEESILNALTAAQTMTGYKQHTAYALPLDRLVSILRQYGRLKG